LPQSKFEHNPSVFSAMIRLAVTYENHAKFPPSLA